MKTPTWLAILTIALAVPLVPGSIRTARIPERIPRDVDPLAAVHLGPPEGRPASGSLPTADCDIAGDDCGSLTPSPSTYWIADGAYNSTEGTLFFVDVPAGDGVFQVDPLTCEVIPGTYYSVNGGLSQRGIGYDAEHHQIWVGGWNDRYLNQHDATAPYDAVCMNYVGLDIAGIAVDDAHDYLFVGTNSYPDTLYVYDITGGALGSLLGSWAVPWQTETNGWDMAGMAYDDGNGMIVMVNQSGSYSGTVRETFDFDIANGPTGYDYCDLSYSSFGWGIGLLEISTPDSAISSSFVTDIGDFQAPVDLDEYGYGVSSVLPPYDFRCGRNEECDITISWTNGQAYDAVNVYDRELSLIAVLPGDATSYTAYDQYFNPCDDPEDNPSYYVSGVVAGEESRKEGGCGWLWIPESFWINFDYSDWGFVPGGDAGWEWGVPSPPGEGKAWETVLGEDYLDNSCGWLDSPFIRLTPCGACAGMFYYSDVECENDGWHLQVSADGGVTWSVLPPYEGYSQGVPTGACEEGLDGPTSCGLFGPGWTSFDLDALQGSTVRFRLLFESN